MALDRNEIVAAALALAEEQGLAALSMRTLAARLGVGASALYWHFSGKAELVTVMANGFYRRGLEDAARAPDWRAWLLAFGHGFRRALLARRDSARLCAEAGPLRDVQSAAEVYAAPLVAFGLPRHAALAALSSVISLALGWSIYEQNEALHAYLEEMVGFDESFAAGLSAMVGGFPEPGS